MKLRHCSGTSSSGKIASTGHGSTHAPQSMHSSGSMKYMFAASSVWMQSTGQTSTQEASFTALHEAGIAMGGFGATAVRVTSNGEVRIAGHPAAAVRGAPSQSDLRADVRSGGMAVCAAFGVDPAGAPAPPNIPPGLVVTMRSMASGAMGPSADRAQGALREMAAPLLAPDRQNAAQTELATRAGGREVPAITPFLPEGEVAPARQTVAPAPAPYIAPPRREDTPVRSPASYDAPDRPLQTYPGLPAITFPPAPVAPPAPAPVA